MSAPTRPGFYWAKWMIADDDVPEGYTPFKTWEPVEVYWHDGTDKPDAYAAWLIGHEFSQGLDCFHWGDELVPPLDKSAALKKETDDRALIDARDRYLKMTPDQREEWLQAQRRKP